MITYTVGETPPKTKNAPPVPKPERKRSCDFIRSFSSHEKKRRLIEHLFDEENEEDVVLKELITEINNDKYFDLFQFLASQDREQLLGFIGHYLEESEDIRLVVMAYLWYKSDKSSPTKDFLS